jgi:predicted transcriptional regulator of viral defense system
MGIPRVQLQRLCSRGDLVRVERGLYRAADGETTELASVAEVAKRAPGAVMCLLTALQMHGLTTEVPHEVWILIHNRSRAPRIEYPRLHVVRASGEAATHGIEQRKIEGVDVHLTNPAKTVADCFRYRDHVGLDVALEALREYRRRSRRGTRFTVDAVVAAARADRVYSVIRPYLEALA